MRERLRNRLLAVSFEASVIDGEQDKIVVSVDETDLLLDTLPPMHEPDREQAPRESEADCLCEALRQRIGSLHLQLLSTSRS